MRLTWLASAATLALLISGPTTARAQVTEGFDTAVTLSDGTTFGACKQLVARMTGGGAITVASSRARINTPTNAAGAMLGSKDALPANYSVSADVGNVTVADTAQNFIELLGISTQAVRTGASTVFNNTTTVEIVAYPNFGIVVGVYASDNSVRTWNGTGWVTSYVAAISTFAPSDRFTIGISRATSGVKITINRNGSQVVNTTRLPLASVRNAAAYVAVGVGTTDFGASTLDLHSLSIPRPAGCTPPTPDSGVTPRDAGVPPADKGVPPGDSGTTTGDSGTTTGDSAAPQDNGIGPTVDAPVASSDFGGGGGAFDAGFNPNLPKGGGESDGCAVAATRGTGGAVGLVTLGLLALVLAARRRRRRR